MDRLSYTSQAAHSYVNRLSEDTGVRYTADGSLIIHASSALMKFPFFHTASILYGPMREEIKEELWAIGMSRLALLRHVISGGIHRFGISKWAAKGASQELLDFQNRWHNFNERMYRKQYSTTTSPPIVSLWRSIEEGKSTGKEVIRQSNIWSKTLGLTQTGTPDS